MFPETDRRSAQTEDLLSPASQLPVEIDVDAVVDELTNTGIHRPPGTAPAPACDENGFDLPVTQVDACERDPLKVAACPVCGSSTARPTFAIERMAFRVVTCTGCHLGSLHPRPTPAEIAGFYPDEYYGTAGAKFEPVVESLVRLVGARHVRWLTRGLPLKARVLDVGCGRGVLLGALADKGFEVHGFEISEMAVVGADSRAKIRIASSLTEARYPQGNFDQVILWHVLEHLPNPREVLEEIRRILKPGGRLVLAVPNFSSAQSRWAGPTWFHLDLPRHLFHFPKSAVRRLIEECGFDCRGERHFSLRQNPFGWIQSALNRSPALPRNGLYALLKRNECAKTQPLLTRLKLRLAYWLGMPLGVMASFFSACLRTGASVCLLAESRGVPLDSQSVPAKLNEFADSHPECFEYADQEAMKSPDVKNEISNREH